MRTHFEHGPHGTACGRASAKTTTNVYRVDCGHCLNKSQYAEAKKVADQARQDAFMAQVPSTVIEPWKPGQFMLCSSCGNGYFRIGNRTCYGHYQDYVCAKCGHAESRLTETGMSF